MLRRGELWISKRMHANLGSIPWNTNHKSCTPHLCVIYSVDQLTSIYLMPLAK